MANGISFPHMAPTQILRKTTWKYEVIVPEVLYIPEWMKVEFTGMFRKDSGLWIFELSQKAIIVWSSSGLWHCVWLWADNDISDEISFPHLQAVEPAPTLYKSVTWKMEVTCSYKMSVSHHNATRCQNYEIYHLSI
jgi:hypothetical protein